MPSTDPNPAGPVPTGSPEPARPDGGSKPPHQKEQEKHGPAQTDGGPGAGAGDPNRRPPGSADRRQGALRRAS